MSSPVRPERPRPDVQPRRGIRAPGGRALDPTPDLGPARPGFARDVTATRADTALQPRPTRSVAAGGPRGSPRRSKQLRLLDVLGATTGVRAGDDPLSMASPPGFIGGKRLRRVTTQALAARRNAERQLLRTEQPQRMGQLEETIERARRGGQTLPRQGGPGFDDAEEFLALERELERRIAPTARAAERFQAQEAGRRTLNRAPGRSAGRVTDAELQRRADVRGRRIDTRDALAEAQERSLEPGFRRVTPGAPTAAEREFRQRSALRGPLGGGTAAEFEEATRVTTDFSRRGTVENPILLGGPSELIDEGIRIGKGLFSRLVSTLKGR